MCRPEENPSPYTESVLVIAQVDPQEAIVFHVPSL